MTRYCFKHLHKYTIIDGELKCVDCEKEKKSKSMIKSTKMKIEKEKEE